MLKPHHREAHHSLIYQPLHEQLAAAGIRLQVRHKRVKNINFRLKPNLLAVSAPSKLSSQKVAAAITQRLEWVLTQHPKIVAAHHSRDQYQRSETVRLWGKEQSITMEEAQRLEWYRQELSQVMPSLFAKWQPIVGQWASEQRIKKMSTRWGSCNVKARRVWLSVYLPAFPIDCTEYVIVHELCHLHHANHSPDFWQAVAKVMPDYRYWHDMLAGKATASQRPANID
ncbi:M48 family metallopeptidase [Psychrobacter pygoscelis]|uniref:M48 family metallopeptidase n=1 Tax=Psychrobacter pygoscelis TaxID=2488563 RepID=UPI001038ACA5|nr:YgjP-like metallopeptidase domain-containing protein [Psychrobacter pygoscelis]